jgi:hypothetical protein
MGGYIIVGVICLAVGCVFGGVIMALLAVDNINEHHVESLYKEEDK